MVDALRDRGVRNLAMQHRIEVGPGRAVRFDIALPAVRWALEIDVHPEHRTLEGQASDDRRDRCTRRLGWLTEHVGEAELVRDFEAVIDELLESIALRGAEVERQRAAGCWPDETHPDGAPAR